MQLTTDEIYWPPKKCYEYPFLEVRYGSSINCTDKNYDEY